MDRPCVAQSQIKFSQNYSYDVLRRKRILVRKAGKTNAAKLGSLPSLENSAVKLGPSPAGHLALEPPLSDATKILEKTSGQSIEQACERRFEANTYSQPRKRQNESQDKIFFALKLCDSLPFTVKT